MKYAAYSGTVEADIDTVAEIVVVAAVDVDVANVFFLVAEVTRQEMRYDLVILYYALTTDEFSPAEDFNRINQPNESTWRTSLSRAIPELLISPWSQPSADPSANELEQLLLGSVATAVQVAL